MQEENLMQEVDAPHHDLGLKIYQAALVMDKQALSEMQQAGYCINVELRNYNPVRQLARDGQFAAVDFLIYTFNVNLDTVVEGYAMGGHVEQVARLIENGVSRKFAIRGYAFVNNVLMVNNLLRDVDDRAFAIYGFARGGHNTQVIKLLPNSNSVGMAVEGYAHGGHIVQVEKLLTAHFVYSYFEQALRGFARGGYRDYVIRLLGGENFPKLDAVDFAGRIWNFNKSGYCHSPFEDAGYGYAEMGYTEYLDELLKYNNIDRPNLVRWFAKGGHVKQVHGYLQERDSATKPVYLEQALEGYSNGGHTFQYNELFRPWSDKTKINLLSAFPSFLRSSTPLLQRISFIEDNRIREKSLNGVPCERRDFLLKKAERINQLMRENGWNFQQAEEALIKSEIIWLLQGVQLIMDGKISTEVFLLITAELLGCAEGQALDRFRKVNQQLFFSSLDRCQANLRSGHYSFNRYQIQINEIMARYSRVEKVFDQSKGIWP